jgi:DNA-binding SARP family transcriptional activator
MDGHRLDLAPKFASPDPTGLLRERLLAVGSRRVGVVLAPAGHGKTTLLGHVAARFDGDVAWYRLDAGDRRADRLAAGIARTLRPLGADPAVLPAVKDQAADAAATLDDVAAALDRARPRRPLLLVLDDFHEVAGGEAERDLARFVSHAPPELHVLLGARRVAGLNLVELRMSGGAVVLEEEDLRFRSWEVERLFRDVYGAPLGPEDAAALTRRTEGWAAGLAMFHLLTGSRPAEQRRRAIEDLSRGSRLVRTYLVREVLGDLPADLREFLRRTSALGVLTGPLCDALLERTGSQEVLEELEQRRLFTTTDDDGRCFRYHQVLLDHLELELTDHLGAVETRAWYARAATLLLDAGEVTAAFRAYARAEDWGAVEQLLHRHGAEVVATPLGTVENLLPMELASQDPWLLLATARRLAARGALADAVTTFRHAGDVAEDAQVATICREEARVSALWLPSGDPQARGPAGLMRAATRRNPRQVLTAALTLDGPDGRLASAVAALLSGDVIRASSLLDQAGAHPDAAPRTVTVVACLREAVALLAAGPRGGREPSLETLLLGADVAGWLWLARLGRALLDAAAGETASLTRLAAEADREADLWGSALLRLIDGVARRDADLLTDAAARLARLDAPVPAQWARCLAAAVERDADPVRTDETVRAARALGMRDVEFVVRGWADAVAATPSGRTPAAQAGQATQAPPAQAPPGTPPGGVPATARLEVRVLGRFELSVGGEPLDLGGVRPRARSTLRLLALRAGDVVHRDVLATTLWPDAGAEAALRSLQVAISSLRALLEPDGERGRLLVRDGEGYRLALPRGSHCDLREFEAAVAAARHARSVGDAAGERAALEEALARYTGDLLPEEGAAEWVVGERDRLRLAAASAAEALARRLAADDADGPAAVDAARHAVELDAYRDSAWRLLVQLHEATGDQAAAHAAREGHRKVLEELGVPL